jgi:uncharacterized repeat protein (TIGR01451 family)
MGVRLRNQLPPEVRFQSSTEGGRPGEGEVLWDLGALQPGEEKRVRVTATCERTAVAAVNRATATADPGVTASDQATVEILGVPAFRLEVKDIGDPVQVGQEVTYKVWVTNTGSLPASGVEVKAFLPAELQLVSGGVDGPMPAVVRGQEVVFGKKDRVPPGERLEYTIRAKGLKAGDVRFRVELRSQALQQPVTQEESTRVYDPPPGANAAPRPSPVPAVSGRDYPARLPPGPPP